jgi:hypothetical protein
MIGTRLVSAALVLAIAGTSSLLSAQLTAPGEAQMWRTVVTNLEAAALVSVRMKDGSRMKGTVLRVGDETFALKPRTRIPVAARELRFDDVASIERTKPSMSPAKKVLLGVGIGAGVYALAAAIVIAAVGFD